MTEFRVLTECGRNFCWSAIDYDNLFRRLTERGYRATKAELMSEYEAECERQYEQARLERELQDAVEKGGAA